MASKVPKSLNGLPFIVSLYFRQGFAQIWVGTEVKRRLVLLIPDAEVRTISCQEAGDGSRRFFVIPSSTNAHQKLHEMVKNV